jgi:hypothetical protein
MIPVTLFSCFYDNPLSLNQIFEIKWDSVINPQTNCATVDLFQGKYESENCYLQIPSLIFGEFKLIELDDWFFSPNFDRYILSEEQFQFLKLKLL